MSKLDRAVIAKLARAAHAGLISVAGAAEALSLSRREAALKLATLARAGWLLRARQGLYLVLPLEADPGKPIIAEDPWVLAQEVFSPCYIGGWSAAEHWELTEQLFRSTLVVTAASVRTRSLRLLGYEFYLFRVPRSRITGVVPVWRGAERVLVSDRERTLVDGLRHPELCGGIRHLAEILREYGQSRDRSLEKLITVAREAGNGAVWKRLGYLAELLWPDADALRTEAKNHLTMGYVKLDPDVRGRGRLVRRWRLWINVPVSRVAEAA